LAGAVLDESFEDALTAICSFVDSCIGNVLEPGQARLNNVGSIEVNLSDPEANISEIPDYIDGQDGVWQ